MRIFSEVFNGIFKENPTFRLVLGMCPTLALTTSLDNAIGMGLAATFVLICSNMAISALRNVIPSTVRIPSYIVIVAGFVTTVDLLLQAYAPPQLVESLGIYIPLIVVNCIILGRAEAFASKNPVLDSAADGLGMGLGFTCSLSLISVLREFLGSGSITVWGDFALKNLNSHTVTFLILPAGGFVTLGVLMAIINLVSEKAARRKGLPAPEPLQLDCRHCALCKLAGK